MLDLTMAFAAFPVLETKRFILREITLGDAGAIFEIMRDPQVTHYFGSLPMTSLDQAIERINGIQTAFREHRGVRWAITERTSGQFIGSVGFWRIEKAHFRAEIGYELGPTWWGRGAMTEAVGAMLEFGFTCMGFHSVEAQIDPANTGSRRVLEKLGFVQEGYFRENYFDPGRNHFTDTAVFSLLHANWEKRGL